MTSVHISTKYAIDPNDVELLPQNKRTWWMRDTLNNTFVNAFPKLPCTEAFDINIDIPDSEYTIGTGDYNVLSAGKHVSQRIVFYVQNGQIHYCKRNELPSLNGGAAPSTSAYNPFGGATAQDNAPKENYIPLEGNIYCTKGDKYVTGDYNCIVDYMADGSIGIEECASCVHSRKLFYSENH